jgi:hypothetical protein
MDTFSRVDKNRIVKKEISKLKKLLKNIPKDKLTAAEGLIQESAYMRATLSELKWIIDREGPLDNFVQGDNEYLREHPAVKSYNSMIQRYSTVTKQVFDLLPSEDKKSPIVSDEEKKFMEFIKGAKV